MPAFISLTTVNNWLSGFAAGSVAVATWGDLDSGAVIGKSFYQTPVQASNCLLSLLVIPGLTRDPGRNYSGRVNRYYYVYILASKRNGTFYIGVTNDLKKRVWEHKENLVDGFTKEYGVHMLVYYETHEDIHEAILREKRIKKWKRQWKLDLIEKANPEWHDLFNKI